MRRSTWILIGGIALAGILLAAGELNARRLQEKALAQKKAIAESICDLPVPPEQASGDAAKPFDPFKYASEEAAKDEYNQALVAQWLAGGNKSTGDPKRDLALAFSYATDESIKAALDPRAIDEARRVAACYAKLGKVPNEAEIHAAKSWPRVAAAIVAILGALPWAWYFLLRRVTELSAAIRGNRPSD